MRCSEVLLHSIKYLKRNLYSSIYLTAATSTIKIHGNVFVSGRKINPVTFRENNEECYKKKVLKMALPELRM